MGEAKWRQFAAASALFVLSVANFILLNSEPRLWRAFAGARRGTPSMATLRSWDAIQWAVGVVGLPLAIVTLIWYLFAGRPLRTWDGKVVVAFLVCLVILHANLRWSYEWARETHLAIPTLLARVVTLLSLNAAIYLSIVAVMVVLSWLRVRRNQTSKKGAVCG